jgi:hypothetical protein
VLVSNIGSASRIAMSSWKEGSWGSKEKGKRDKSWQEKSPSKKQATGKDKATGSNDGGKQRLATPPREQKRVHPFLHHAKKLYLISTFAYKRSEPHHQGKVRLPDYYIMHLKPDRKIVLEEGMVRSLRLMANGPPAPAQSTMNSKSGGFAIHPQRKS